MAAFCYANPLGDCRGRLEDEHFISHSIQRMLGPVTVEGLKWQRDAPKQMGPGSYAHSRILCEKHHDELDGLDAVALGYFRNVMLIAGGNAEPDRLGRREDLVDSIDGRALERWFMKTICGAIAADAVKGKTIPSRWIEGLFGRIQWPDEWALHVEVGRERTIRAATDNRVRMMFFWDKAGGLNGYAVDAFTFPSMFSIKPPDELCSNWLRRPKLLGAQLKRPGNGDTLIGLPAGTDIAFKLRWP